MLILLLLIGVSYAYETFNCSGSAQLIDHSLHITSDEQKTQTGSCTFLEKEIYYPNTIIEIRRADLHQRHLRDSNDYMLLEIPNQISIKLYTNLIEITTQEHTQSCNIDTVVTTEKQDITKTTWLNIQQQQLYIAPKGSTQWTLCTRYNINPPSKIKWVFKGKTNNGMTQDVLFIDKKNTDEPWITHGQNMKQHIAFTWEHLRLTNQEQMLQLTDRFIAFEKRTTTRLQKIETRLANIIDEKVNRQQEFVTRIHKKLNRKIKKVDNKHFLLSHWVIILLIVILLYYIRIKVIELRKTHIL